MNFKIFTLDDSLDTDSFSKLTSGLSLRVIEKLFRKSSLTKNKKLSSSIIKKIKADNIKKFCGDLLEVFETDLGFDSISSLYYIKKYFENLKKQIKAGGEDIVRAILMVGVPGVGKSFSVRAFAKELGFNCVSLRNVRSMWVGESERNLERAFNTIEALSPTILFFDEIDQALGQRGTQGDSGVSQRILARIWEFMAMEKLRGKIIFMAATNMPSLLDPATKDRFGVTIPFLLPTSNELKRLIPLLSNQLGIKLADQINLDDISILLNEKKISPRQTLDVISMSKIFTLEKNNKEVDEKSLLKAANSFQPNSDPIELERITLEAIRMTTFNELFPWYGVNKPFNLPPFTENIVDKYSGAIDNNKLNERLKTLQNM